MSEWKDITLREVIVSANTGLDAIRRAPIVEYDTGIKCLRIQDISRSKKYEEWGFTEVEKKNFERFQLKEGDIIIARTGSTIGVNTLIKDSLQSVFNNGLIRLRTNEQCNVEYLYYNFQSYEFKGFIDAISGGTSTQPNMQINSLLDYELALPPLPEQTAIASVLSSLDDKIDLLHRQNETLEKMAETLFRQWFVEEAEEDWEEKPLSSVTDIAIGRTPPRKEVEWFSTDPADVKWISIKDLGNDGVFISKTSEYLTREAIEKFNIPIIPKSTVVLSFKMTVGRVAITSEDMLSNEAIAHFKFNENTPFSKEYLYLFLKLFKYDTLGSTSSIVTAINSKMIKELEIPIPDKNTMEFFKSRTMPLFNKIKSNQTQIRTLTQLRDTLLPKLMNGDVRVEFK